MGRFVWVQQTMERARVNTTPFSHFNNVHHQRHSRSRRQDMTLHISRLYQQGMAKLGTQIQLANIRQNGVYVSSSIHMFCIGIHWGIVIINLQGKLVIGMLYTSVKGGKCHEEQKCRHIGQDDMCEIRNRTKKNSTGHKWLALREHYA